MKQGTSGLTLRETKTYFEPVIELTPKNVKAWAKNLPIANLGESSRSTYRLLVDVNQSVIEPEKRFTLLNNILPVADKLVSLLEKQFINNRINLTDKQKKIAALVQAIQTEVSICLHAIIESITSNKHKRINKKLIASATGLAIRYKSCVILRCYQLYTSIPDRIWRELYCLYKIAQKYEIEETPVCVEYSRETLTCHGYFLQILLLSIANPYQLRQSEIGLLWKILPEIQQHASLNSHAYNKQHYIVPLNSCLPPVHKSLYNAADNQNNLKLTALSTLDYLNQKLTSFTTSGADTTRNIMVLRHLIQAWNHGTHRAFARTACDAELDVSIGLGSTHFLLIESENQNDVSNNNNTASTLDTMEGSLKHATLLDVTQDKEAHIQHDLNYMASDTQAADVWEKLYQQHKSTNYIDPSRSKDSIVRDSYKIQSVNILNISPNGYCVQIDAENLPKYAQTGEILGFLEIDNYDQKHWSVGIVRWVRRKPKVSQVLMGVQLLAPDASPIDMQLRNSRGDKNEYQKALLLPALTGIGQPETVITNPLSFSMNSKVRIMNHGEIYDARLSREVSASGSYRQFCFDKLNPEKTIKPKLNNINPGNSSDPDELDGVWDLI